MTSTPVISESAIGIAAKEASEVIIDNTVITKCTDGLVVFTKKPYFSSARVDLQNSLLGDDVKRPYRVEETHILVIDGQRQSPTDKLGSLAPIFYLTQE